MERVDQRATEFTYGLNKELRGSLSKPSLRLTAIYATQSIRLRFGRCLITAACVIGAIAFLAYNALSLETRPTTTPEVPVISSQSDFFVGLEEFTGKKSVRQKRVFVVVLSLLVALVGITNSMLMQIKERYREIATLKCLGAVNGYVRRLFMLEALIQGAVGSATGIGLGLLLYRMFQGSLGSISWVLTVAGACLGLGLVMTLLASIWPIRAALAMMPIDALRVEE